MRNIRKEPSSCKSPSKAKIKTKKKATRRTKMFSTQTTPTGKSLGQRMNTKVLELIVSRQFL